MKIAIISGKGGTGKTTISANLSKLLGMDYIDCDVEEPNGFLFLKPEIKERKNVVQNYPKINQENCTLCKACVNVCQFNALAKAGDEIMVFEKLCHDCGACSLVCAGNAITMWPRLVGIIETGYAEGKRCKRGVLKIGEPMAVPVIRALVSELGGNDCILDCPPGTSCSVVASIKKADIAILVTEPTKFGLHDLLMAEKLVAMYHLPFGIIINKDDGKDNVIRRHCRKDNVRLLGAVPFSREAAKAYSNGEMLIDQEMFKKVFLYIAEKVREVFS